MPMIDVEKYSKTVSHNIHRNSHSDIYKDLLEV